MGDPISQDGRTGRITTPLTGDEAVALARFDGNEGLSDLFEFRCEVVSLADNIDFNKALGQSVTVTITSADKKPRHFNGLLIEARWAGQRGDLYVYQLVLRPWLHLLTLASDCRIFQNKSVKDILKVVFDEQGFSYRDDTKGDYPVIEYCVQYRETHFAFVSRMMEKWGIYYYFEHADGAHTLVAADQKACHHACTDLPTVKFISVDQAGRYEIQHLEDWSRGRVAESGKFTLRDYNYTDSTASLQGDKSGQGPYSHSDMERYDAPGGYYQRSEGDHLAQVELEAAQSLDDRRTGNGSALSLFPGSLTTLTGQSADSENQEYLVVACSHYFTGESFRTGDQVDQAGYVGSFEFAPSSTPFRAELLTSRPTIPGVQSALVVGQQGEEIDVDDQGRIAVQFYWDRKQSASRRIRVSQPAAGKDRGAFFLPRIGDEVLVQYDDGDPDRPVATGSVYNSANPLTLKVPANKTVTGLLGKSSKGGGSTTHNANAWWFDDLSGSEKFHVRARKDYYVRVYNDENRHVTNNQVESVDANVTKTVGGDETITIGGPTGGGNFTLNAAKTMKINVGPKEMPVTQILMDTSSITLNVGPSGTLAQLVMNSSGITLSFGPGGSLGQVMLGPTGVTISGTPASQLMVQPEGISTMTTMMNLMAGPITFVSPMVTIPLVTIGAGTASGMPLI